MGEHAAGAASDWSYRRILRYSSPLLAVNFVSALFSTYYLKFGTDVLLVAPAAMGVIYAGARLWEAISDPIVGFLSDRTRHRLGRRRSWLLGATVPLCLCPLLMWTPPSALRGSALWLWLSFASVGFATALSAFHIPHAALGAEMSPLSSDRTRFFATNGVMSALGSFAALAGGMRLLRTADDPRATALWLFAGAALLTALFSFWMVARTSEPAHHQGRGASSPISAYRDVWKNPHARILIFVGLFIQMTFAAMSAVAVFMLEYVLMMPDQTEFFMVCYFVPTLLSVPLWLRLSNRFEKRHLWAGCLAASALAYGALGVTPEGVSIWVAFPIAALMGVAGGGFFVFEPSIRAEVIDFDEYETGERKEGVYSASSQLAGKVSGALTAAGVGFALQWSGYVPNQEQSESVKWVIRGIFGGVPALFFLTAFVMLLNFKLSERQHAGIRVALDRREAARRDSGANSG